MAKNMEKETIEALPVKSELAKTEESILAFWKENNIFEKTLKKESPQGEYVFYEGPPTANGRPGLHHLEARAFKDAIPRYKTMRGFHVSRKGGWDTHGLPVELEVEKKLGLKSKKEIEQYGIEKFNNECRKSVWTYVDEWKEFTNRIGYWVDMENPYVTYHTSYIESIWNIVKQISDKDLLYKDYKVVPWCPRCGTALSSHELAQGYADVKDLSVYAKFKVIDRDDTYILAWTTTPWTLPGNVALAVGKNIEYVEITVTTKEEKKEAYILAKNRLGVIEGGYEIVREMKGEDLVGLSYEPLYPYLKKAAVKTQGEQVENAYKVYEAGFVTTEDGTGIVHTAVMYGQDDFELGTKYNLPKYHLVDETGHFTKDAGDFAGRFVKDEEVAIDVIKDLAHRGLLFKKEKYEHSYPFCWRCKTPLIYYARDSWYIQMSSVRDDLIAQNAEIGWEPEYIRDGRFGDWLREVKDWAISRERYWGTPLPIWLSTTGERFVVDSIETLKNFTKKNNNTFLFVRHGEAESNAEGIVTSDEKADIKLTQKGKDDIATLAQFLKERNVTAVYASPFVRTQESAHIIADTIGFKQKNIVTDERIREFNFGEYSGKPFEEYLSYKKEHMQNFNSAIPAGESFLDAKKRFGEFLYEIDQKHTGETIVVVTHGIGLEVISAVIQGADTKRSEEIVRSKYFNPGEVLEFAFTPLPHNENFELDLHRPFIDDVVLMKEGIEYRRVKEVMDVWFDSGAMPLAQHHYPFENKELVDSTFYPADFISEAIDQTRGWFYTLHAIGVLLGRGKAYKNVICLGHILDKDGQKMSKSRGNTINPWEAVDTYGVDVLRFWMYTVNQPGESKNFDPRTVDDITKKVFNLLENVVKFYELYAGNRSTSERPDSSNVLDKWILALFDQTVITVTEHMDSYRVLEAARAIREFIAELSQWYVRRSRDRFKETAVGDDTATATLGFVLEQTAILMAPFTPFFAEHIYQRVKIEDGKESVHLTNWPETREVDVDVLAGMKQVQSFSTIGLKLRAEDKIPVRQPLASFSIKHSADPIPYWEKLKEILKDELNVKEIILDKDSSQDEPLCKLDSNITQDLRREGDARELMRAIQEMRKEKSLSPSDRISVNLLLTPEGKNVVASFESDIKETCGIETITIGDMAENASPWFVIQY